MYKFLELCIMKGGFNNMIPIIGDVLKNSLGVVASKLMDKYLPKSMDEKEKAEMLLEMEKLVLEEGKVLQAQMETINATMREEAKSDKFIVYAWRPLVGFCFVALIGNNFILMPYFAVYGLQPIIIPDGIWSAMLVVLGVSAGTRGIEKMWRTKNK